MDALQESTIRPSAEAFAPQATSASTSVIEAPAAFPAVGDVAGLAVDLAQELDRLQHLDWSLARCRDTNHAAAIVTKEQGFAAVGELFFSDEIPAIRAAKAICADCSLAEDCFTGALVRREPWGVWGGRLFKDGKVLAVKRPRGRPPKDPARQMTA